MTIKEAATTYGVSTQAIYQRIAKSGKKAKDLTEGKTSDLSPEGEALLASWFATEQESLPEKTCENCQHLERENATLQALNTALQEQIAALQVDKERLYMLLSQAQQTQAMTVARLPDGRGSIWERLKKRLSNGQKGG